MPSPLSTLVRHPPPPACAGVTLVVDAGWEARTARSIALAFRWAPAGTGGGGGGGGGSHPRIMAAGGGGGGGGVKFFESPKRQAVE